MHEKIFLGLVLACFFSVQMDSQDSIADYEFVVNFEDNVGRTDSVIFRYDSSVTQSSHRTPFGWKDIITNPMNANFEVRGGDIFRGDEWQSKIVVGGFGSFACKWGSTTFYSVVLQAKDFPVRMSWDSEYFAVDDCRDWSRITRDWDVTRARGIPPDNLYVRMAIENELVITKQWLRETENRNSSFLQDVEGGGKDTMYVIWVGMGSMLTTISGVTSKDHLPLQIYPNPCINVLTFQLDEGIENHFSYEIHNIKGSLMQSGTLNHNLIDIAELPTGMYLLEVLTKNEKQYLAHFIKE